MLEPPALLDARDTNGGSGAGVDPFNPPPPTPSDPPEPITDAVTAPVPRVDDQASARRVEAKSLPTSIRDRAAIQALAAQVLIACSVGAIGFVAFVFLLSALPEQRAQTGLERRFSTALANGKALVGGPIPAGTPVVRLDVDRLGIHQIVVDGTSADQLRAGPGHLAVSPLPGQPGNAVIAAHRLAWGAPFGGLSGLRHGDLIRVLTGQGHFTYRVMGRAQVRAQDVGPLQAKNDNRLTLVTAGGLDASRRLVVVAQLVGSPQPAPPSRPSVLASSEGGLVGAHGAWTAIGWWGQLLLLVAIATVLLYRRLPLWSSYLITTPILLACLWLVYENLARLLPATL